jgi:hypothetical protein
MSFATGVASQCGWAPETVWGTQVTPTNFADFDGNPTPKLTQKWYEGKGLYATGQYDRISRTQQTTRMGAASFTAEYTARKMGSLIRQALGSATATPTLISGSAYRQVHSSGTQDGLSMTWQVGVPEVSTGTVKPFMGVGGKVTDFEFSCKEDDALHLALGWSFKDVLTLATTPASNALASASYTLPSEIFTWDMAVIKIGGTASTASGVVSIAGGVTVSSVVKGFSLKTTNNLAGDGYGPSQTMSREQKSGGASTALTLDTELGTQAEFYDMFRAGGIMPVQVTFTGRSLISGAIYSGLDIILPGTKISDSDPQVGGRDNVSPNQVQIKVGKDDLGNAPMQVTLTSLDSVL